MLCSASFDFLTAPWRIIWSSCPNRPAREPYVAFGELKSVQYHYPNYVAIPVFVILETVLDKLVRKFETYDDREQEEQRQYLHPKT